MKKEPKERPVNGIKMAAEQPSWMKGLTQGEIDAILGRPTRDSSGVKRSDKKKKKKVITAKEGRKVLQSMDKKSPDFTQGLDKKFSARVAEQNKKSLKGNQKKLDANNDGKITGADFEILRKNPDAKKKYGGKITYRMTGGQVVDSTYDQQSKHSQAD